MNKENAKDYLPLVKALADGKVIQCRWNDGGVKFSESWDFTRSDVTHSARVELPEK